MGGPIGAAVGGVVGGLYGLVSSFQDAEKEIRSAKVGEALSSLGTRITNISRGGSSSAEFSSARGNLADYLSQNRERAVAASTSFLGFDAGAFSRTQQKNLRSDLGNQLPSFLGILQRESEQLGRSNLGETAITLSERLRQGGSGLNNELISIVSRLRGVSIASVLEDATKQIASAQRSERLAVTARAGIAASEQYFNTFGRLTVAFSSAADAVQILETKSKALSDAFEGNVSAIHVTSNGNNLAEPGSPGQGFLRPLETIASVVGGDAGDRLLSQGRGVDQIAAVLPGVLARSLAGNRLENPEDFSSAVSRNLATSLGHQNGQLPQNLLGIGNIISREINQSNITHIKDKIQTDSTAYSRDLLRGASDPLKTNSDRITKLLDENANRFISGLSRMSDMLNKTDETLSRRDTLSLSGFQQTQFFSAQAAGRRDQALDFIPLSRFDEPFNARQGRLTSFAGERANNPTEIGSKTSANSIRNSRFP